MVEENYRLPNSKLRCKKCGGQYVEESDDDDGPKGTLTQGKLFTDREHSVRFSAGE